MLHTCAWFLSSCFFQTLLLQLVQIIACSLKKKKKIIEVELDYSAALRSVFCFVLGFGCATRLVES